MQRKKERRREGGETDETGETREGQAGRARGFSWLRWRWLRLLRPLRLAVCPYPTGYPTRENIPVASHSLSYCRCLFQFAATVVLCLTRSSLCVLWTLQPGWTRHGGCGERRGDTKTTGGSAKSCPRLRRSACPCSIGMARSLFQGSVDNWLWSPSLDVCWRYTQIEHCRTPPSSLLLSTATPYR